MESDRQINKTSHKLKWLFKCLRQIVISLLLTMIIVFVLHWPSMEVIKQWKQPADMVYDNWDPYYISVVSTDIDWKTYPFNIGIERNYIIYVGRDSGKPSYGHMIKYSFHSGYKDLREFLNETEVNWLPEGVQLILASGHRLFIPKKMFIGGR